MLNDEHIHFANELLHEQFPNARGLQQSVFSEDNSPFVQILFNNEAHWVTVEAVDGSTIKVYDSTNHKPNMSVQIQASG